LLRVPRKTPPDAQEPVKPLTLYCVGQHPECEHSAINWLAALLTSWRSCDPHFDLRNLPKPINRLPSPWLFDVPSPETLFPAHCRCLLLRHPDQWRPGRFLLPTSTALTASPFETLLFDPASRSQIFQSRVPATLATPLRPFVRSCSFLCSAKTTFRFMTDFQTASSRPSAWAHFHALVGALRFTSADVHLAGCFRPKPSTASPDFPPLWLELSLASKFLFPKPVCTLRITGFLPVCGSFRRITRFIPVPDNLRFHSVGVVWLPEGPTNRSLTSCNRPTIQLPTQRNSTSASFFPAVNDRPAEWRTCRPDQTIRFVEPVRNPFVFCRGIIRMSSGTAHQLLLFVFPDPGTLLSDLRQTPLPPTRIRHNRPVYLVEINLSLSVRCR